MAFEISQLKNTYLKDAAIIADSNNNGVINDGREISIFLEKVDDIVRNGLCSDEEYREILSFCPREVETKKGVIQIGVKEYTHNQKAQEFYFEQFEIDIDNELKDRNLEKTPENIAIVVEIIKQKKDLNILIKIQEAKIEKLINGNYRDTSALKEEIVISGSLATGALAGAFAGFKIGIPFGVPGMVAGLLGGALAGSLVGGFGGASISKFVFKSENIDELEQQSQELLDSEMQKLNELKAEYEKLG